MTWSHTKEFKVYFILQEKYYGNAISYNKQFIHLIDPLFFTCNKFLNEDLCCSSHLERSNGNHGTEIKIVGNVEVFYFL
jgi:hypothetical protein